MLRVSLSVNLCTMKSTHSGLSLPLIVWCLHLTLHSHTNVRPTRQSYNYNGRLIGSCT